MIQNCQWGMKERQKSNVTSILLARTTEIMVVPLIEMETIVIRVGLGQKIKNSVLVMLNLRTH